MEKNFRATIIDTNCNQKMLMEDFETAAQAIIAIKTYGHEEKKEGKEPTGILWVVGNRNPNKAEGDLFGLSGIFDKEWSPTIKSIETM